MTRSVSRRGACLSVLLASCGSIGPPPTVASSEWVEVEQQASGLVRDAFSGARRVRWRGRCVGYVPQSVPHPNTLPPPPCLAGTTIEETPVEGDHELRRAEAWTILDSAELREAFDACLDGATGQSCVEALAGQAPDARADAPPPQPASKTARCEKIDQRPEAIDVRCTGSLVEAFCEQESVASFDERVERLHCEGANVLMLSVPLGPSPGRDCVRAAQAALESPEGDFVRAERAAFAACMRDEREYSDDVDVARQLGEELDEKHYLPLASTALLHAVLERHRARLGTLTLPERCGSEGSECVADEPQDVIAQVVARGCGQTVWEWAALSESEVGDGSWSEREGRALVLVPDGAPLVVPSETFGDDCGPWDAIGRSCRAGNLLDAQEREDPERELIARTCVHRGGDLEACERATLTDLSPHLPGDDSETEDDDANDDGDDDGDDPDLERAELERARELVARDWPHAAARLASEHAQIESGILLDASRGERFRQRCEPLLIDPCSGVAAEVCVSKSSEQLHCDGRQLEDGRCERFHIVRLPVRISGTRQ